MHYHEDKYSEEQQWLQTYSSNPVHRHPSCQVDLRQVFRRQSNTHMILHFSFHSSLHHYSPSSCPPTIPSWSRIQQPHKNPIWHRQNPVLPLLHNQRHPRHSTTNSILTNTSPTFTQLLGDPDIWCFLPCWTPEMVSGTSRGPQITFQNHW